jgi:hypothetical protein
MMMSAGLEDYGLSQLRPGVANNRSKMLPEHESWAKFTWCGIYALKIQHLLKWELTRARARWRDGVHSILCRALSAC